jgi:hypothetical protein
MTIEQLREVYTAQPFRPFVLNLADGRKVPVLSRDLIMASPSGRMIIVVQPDDSMNMIDVPFVTDLELTPGKPRKGRR